MDLGILFDYLLRCNDDDDEGVATVQKRRL
jgi:hypothetical protein